MVNNNQNIRPVQQAQGNVRPQAQGNVRPQFQNSVPPAIHPSTMNRNIAARPPASLDQRVRPVQQTLQNQNSALNQNQEVSATKRQKTTHTSHGSEMALQPRISTTYPVPHAAEITNIRSFAEQNLNQKFKNWGPSGNGNVVTSQLKPNFYIPPGEARDELIRILPKSSQNKVLVGFHRMEKPAPKNPLFCSNTKHYRLAYFAYVKNLALAEAKRNEQYQTNPKKISAVDLTKQPLTQAGLRAAYLDYKNSLVPTKATNEQRPTHPQKISAVDLAKQHADLNASFFDYVNSLVVPGKTNEQRPTTQRNITAVDLTEELLPKNLPHTTFVDLTEQPLSQAEVALSSSSSKVVETIQPIIAPIPVRKTTQEANTSKTIGVAQIDASKQLLTLDESSSSSVKGSDPTVHLDNSLADILAMVKNAAGQIDDACQSKIDVWIRKSSTSRVSDPLMRRGFDNINLFQKLEQLKENGVLLDRLDLSFAKFLDRKTLKKIVELQDCIKTIIIPSDVLTKNIEFAERTKLKSISVVYNPDRVIDKEDSYYELPLQLLKGIDITDCKHLTDRFVKGLKNLPLETLVIRGTNLTGEYLNFERLPKLKTIDVRDCPQISQERIDSLTQQGITVIKN